MQLFNILNGNGEYLNNVKFINGEYSTKIDYYDDVVKKYIRKFTIDKFTNFHNNTIAVIPLATIDINYEHSIFDISINNNWVTVSADIEMDVVVKVLMIQYNVS